MTPDLTPQQASHLAEARIWNVLISTDSEITAQFGPSRVRDLANLRLTFLNEALADLPDEDRDSLLEYSLTDEQKAVAFTAAAAAMHDTFGLIDAVVSLGATHGVA